MEIEKQKSSCKFGMRCKNIATKNCRFFHPQSHYNNFGKQLQKQNNNPDAPKEPKFQVIKLEEDPSMVEIKVNLYCQEKQNCIINNTFQICKYNHPDLFKIETNQLPNLTEIIQQQQVSKRLKTLETFRNSDFQSDLQKYQNVLINNWMNVDVLTLQKLSEILSLQNLFNPEFYMNQIKDALYNGKMTFDEAYEYITGFGDKKKNSRDFIEYLIEIKQVSKAAQYAKKFGFDSEKEFPLISLESGQNFIQYKLREAKKLEKVNKMDTEVQLYHLETLVSGKSERIIFFIKTLFSQFRYYSNYIHSTIKRHQSYINFDTLSKCIDAKEINNFKNNKYQYIPNPFIENDSFAPSEEVASYGVKIDTQNFFNLQRDAGITQKETYMISETESEDYQFCKTQLKSAKAIGIDTESNVAYDKGISLLQFSTNKYIIIFDLLTIYDSSSRNQKQIDELNELLAFLFSNPDILIIGQQIVGDIKDLAKELRIPEFKRAGIVEIQQPFKECYPDETKSSLKVVCETVLNKQMSKMEQCSGWHQRPLRLSQLHYAGLDAYMCLHLWDVIQQKFSDKNFERFIQNEDSIIKNQKDAETKKEENKKAREQRFIQSQQNNGNSNDNDKDKDNQQNKDHKNNYKNHNNNGNKNSNNNKKEQKNNYKNQEKSLNLNAQNFPNLK